MSRLIAQITTSFLIITLSTAALADPTPYRAVYQADYKGLPINALAIRELSRDEKGTYRLSSSAKSFFASVTEFSEFVIQDEHVLPVQYQYHRSGIGKQRDAVLDFDWVNMKVLNNVQSKPWTMAIPVGTLDKLLYQLKVRQDLLRAHNQGQEWPLLKYQIADGGKLKTYEFKVIGEERVTTPLGELNAIKATRIKQRPNRKTTFWLAPEYEFLLVRFHQIENGKGFDLLLKEAEFGGKKLGVASR